ncbi:hypothetical protein [Roseibium alexandrii]|uniref:hypothetical protein n=1 Tax=Roseibium alexandrii TaxID=388408 RepID=UPI003753476B
MSEALENETPESIVHLFPGSFYFPAPPGVTLRDYFAGQALIGLSSGFNGGVGDTEWFEQYGAPVAYKIADAMLEARKQEGGA